MSKRFLPIRRSDLEPAFLAARNAGFSEITVVVETTEGLVLHICASQNGDRSAVASSPLEEWKAKRNAAS